MTRRRIITVGVLVEMLLLGGLIAFAFAQPAPLAQTCEEARDALNVQVIILQNSRTRTEADLAQIASGLQKAQTRITELEKLVPKPTATTTTTIPPKANVK